MHRKGFHCGSTAMGDALRTLGLDLPEELLFGLGAGLAFSVHEGDTTLTPPQASRFFVGRSATFEKDLCAALHVELHEESFATASEAWLRIEELLREKKLPLAYTDLCELPYTGSHGHWFGHLIAVASPEALVWDNGYHEPQAISPEQLQRALCTAKPERGQGCTVLHLSGKPRKAPLQPSIAKNALQMDVAAIRRFADEFPRWQALPDWPRIERLAGQVVEVRGTGGGLFRRAYAQFLLDAGHPGLAAVCTEAAQAWTDLARHADADHARACAEAEAALWTRARELCA
jgi:hypothetical protein